MDRVSLSEEAFEKRLDKRECCATDLSVGIQLQAERQASTKTLSQEWVLCLQRTARNQCAHHSVGEEGGARSSILGVTGSHWSLVSSVINLT